jgi:anti-anti-sigma factor
MERGSRKLEVAVSRTDGAQVVRLVGEFDLAGVDAFETELQRNPRSGEGTVVLDLRELTFIDSSGLRAVLMVDREARAGGGQCLIVKGPDRVNRVLELTGVEQRLEFVDRVPTAPADRD